MLIKRIKKLLFSGKNKRLFSNFISLSLLQGANYILPLITIPYLTRVLGPEQYGLLSLANTFITYFQILTDYGFGLSATREIAVSRNKKRKVNLIYSSVMIIKAILALISFIVMVLILLTISRFRQDFFVYLFTFGNVIGGLLFPVWLFQGLERMKYITFFNLGAKALTTVLIFALIHTEGDLIILILLNSFGSIVTGVVSLIWVWKGFGIWFTRPTWKEIKRQLAEGWNVFISTVSIVIYNATPAFILGILTNNTIVGYFSGAMKIKGAFDGLFIPLYQTLYPYVNNLAAKSKKKAFDFIKKELTWIGLLGLVLAIFLFFESDFLVRFILGEKFAQAGLLLRILAPASFLVIFGFVLTVQAMLAFGLKKDYTKVYLITSFSGLIAAFVFTYFFHAVGTAITIVFVEFLVLILTVFMLYRNRKMFLTLKSED
jgi:PST family polysaccharide transporter